MGEINLTTLDPTINCYGYVNDDNNSNQYFFTQMTNRVFTTRNLYLSDTQSRVGTMTFFTANGYDGRNWTWINNMDMVTNNIDILLQGATNIDSTVKVINNVANLTLCVRIPAIQKGTEYTLGTCNTYSNHYVRHTGSIVTSGNIQGSIFFTIYPNGVIKFSSSVDTSAETVLNDDIMFMTF